MYFVWALIGLVIIVVLGVVIGLGSFLWLLVGTYIVAILAAVLLFVPRIKNALGSKAREDEQFDEEHGID
jgi:DNA integrity scanning protein DisA with diadenylate cyclase activity